MDLFPDWHFVADTVMGGASNGAVTRTEIDGRSAARLTGSVSLENNGGFIQMAADLGDGGEVFDASGWTGLELDVRGNGETYDLRLRTDQLTRPWQSFRAGFVALSGWRSLRFPFSAFDPNKTEAAFDPGRLRRIGVLAVGRAFEVDVSVAGLRLYGARSAAGVQPS
ncbi:CIA30 family protein [Phaeovulum sp.]|uniref:CIA30 family protein n=1 Tax=Phaeovulum sp. TaxID=2934796 RepID=UPI0039E40954